MLKDNLVLLSEIAMEGTFDITQIAERLDMTKKDVLDLVLSRGRLRIAGYSDNGPTCYAGDVARLAQVLAVEKQANQPETSVQ